MARTKSTSHTGANLASSQSLISPTAKPKLEMKKDSQLSKN